MIKFKGASFGFLILLILTINALVYFAINSNNKEQTKQIKLNAITNLESRYSHITKHLKLLAEIYYIEVINQKPVLEILKDLPNSDDHQKSVIREKLYNKLIPVYKRMQKYDFRQLHFHLPNNSSFLRMHKPNLYGDDLSDIRKTIVMTNKTLVSQHGFEEGRIYNGFRNVYPLIYHGIHLGSVELSLSFNAIRTMMEKTYENHFMFIVDKKVVDTKVFKNEIDKNYTSSYLSDDYYFEKKYTHHKKYLSAKEKFDSLSKEQKTSIEEKLKKHQTFSVLGTQNNNDFELTFLAIRNIDNQKVAYIISTAKNIPYTLLKEQYEKEILFMISISFILLAIGIVSILNNQKKIFEIKSYTDPLTKIYNRNKFYENFKEDYSKRSTDHDFCLILLDIDDFKQINDHYGHGVGDDILIELTNVIRNNIRSSDNIYRWGGEEFLITIKAPFESSKHIAQKILSNTQKHNFTHGIHLTCSMGLAKFEDEMNIDSLVKAADDKMYEAKLSGKNQIKY